MSSPAIQFKAVSFARDGVPVLRDVELTIETGEVIGLVGRSGAGKTSLLRLINRLEVPTRGEVLIDGRSSESWDPIVLRRSIGYVIQDVGLFPHLSVARNVAVVPMLERWGVDRIRSRVDELLDLVGLDPDRYRDRFPRELSGGQRQRVGLARALATDPRCVLMDEPFGALDPVTRREVRTEFHRIQQRLHKTVVFVTHDMEEACLLATRIGVMVDGRLALVAPPGELRASDHSEVKALLGV